MRATLWMLTVLVIAMAALAGATTWLCRDSAQTFGQEAEQLIALWEKRDWQGLEEYTRQLRKRWEEREKSLQLVIRHQETDDVSEALDKLEAGITTQDNALCQWAIREFREACRHLYHRDAFTLTNII